RDQVGVIVGSAIGGLEQIEEAHTILKERGPSRISPFTVPMMIADMGAGMISIALGARGPNYCTVSACSSGAHAIGEAFETIRRGDATAMIAGGSEACVTPLALAAFCASRAVSTRQVEPQLASRPFDLERDGFVMGEGAGILILEQLDQIDAGPSARCRRVRGSGDLGESRGGRRCSTHHQPRTSRPAMRPRLHPRGGARAGHQAGALELVRLRRPQRVIALQAIPRL